MIAMPLIAAVAAFQAAPDGPTAATVHPYRIEAEYNRVRDYTSTGVDLDPIGEGRKDDLDARWSLVASHVSSGESRAALGETAGIGMSFYRIGEDRELDDFRSVAILADAFRARPKEEYKSERLDGGRVMERVSWSLTFGEFREMAAASEIEISVGGCDVYLTPRQVAALKDLAARLAVDSKEADKLAFEHVTLLRKRESELREAMEKAVAKAKAEVAKLPPARRAREGNAVGLKTTLAEFGPTSAKYELTKEESRKLAEEFPIIGEAILELKGSTR